MTFITLSCIAVSFMGVAFLNRLFWTFNRSLTLSLNKIITTRYAGRIFAFFSFFMRFYFAGEKNLKDQLPDQYLVMSNHQSLLDIPLFMRFLDGSRLRFIAKAELGKHVPVVSLVLTSDRHCLIDRKGSPSKLMKTIDEFALRVRQNGTIPVIFPEGTRSVDGKLGVFHAAGFRRFLDKAPMPVAVCAIDGGWRVSTLGGMAKNMRGGHYRVKILRIFPAPQSKADQLRILEEGKALIQAQLDAWRQ